MPRDTVSEYTQAEIEAFVEASRKYDRQAPIGALMVFVVSALMFAALLWGVFTLLPDPQLRIYCTVGLGAAMVIAAVSYWGFLLLPRIEWLVSQSQGIGQRVYDTQRKMEEI
ncbi:MAG: hypothetical protein K8F53_01395 [Rhodocyclaceae bacterium]|nr:hypothetical protein [Rhodocyclaceae bacterium]